MTGAAGSFGRLAVPWLVERGWRVHAVDREQSPDWVDREGVLFHAIDFRKRAFEDVLRREKPAAILHLAGVRDFALTAEQRHRINFEGTVHVFQTGVRNGVGKIVFASRATVYGALPDQPQFVTEDHPPSAGRTFPEMQDLVAADLYACGMLWQHPETESVVLRPVNVLGPAVRGLLNRYLARKRIFTVAGFDPMYQVLHQHDLARAFDLALARGVRGVFNITGPGEVPLHVLIDEAGAARVPLPEPLIRVMKGRLGFPTLPDGAIDFLKYACTVDGTRFRKATGFAPEKSLKETLAAIPDARG